MSNDIVGGVVRGIGSHGCNNSSKINGHRSTFALVAYGVASFAPVDRINAVHFWGGAAGHIRCIVFRRTVGNNRVVTPMAVNRISLIKTFKHVRIVVAVYYVFSQQAALDVLNIHQGIHTYSAISHLYKLVYIFRVGVPNSGYTVA